jgi:hypothetical protein
MVIHQDVCLFVPLAACGFAASSAAKVIDIKTGT